MTRISKIERSLRILLLKEEHRKGKMDVYKNEPETLLEAWENME